jgi:uracil-DNA glycosylase
MARNLEELISAVRQEADRVEFPVDEPVYRRSGRDPKEPILFAGSLEAPICFVGRDLGKDEVRAGEPLIGAAGRLVRTGILEAWEGPGRGDLAATGEAALHAALKHAVLTNTVPYKPPGNKAYPDAVRERFRPFLETLLARYWKGDQVITLGREAFLWFEPYISRAEFESRGATDARYESVFPCRLPRPDAAKVAFKEILLYPLPHPSPLNRRWYSRFPSMLADRLAEARRHHANSSGA